MISRRRFLLGSLLSLFASQLQAGTSQLPWRNWSGGQRSNPVSRFAPTTEDELASILPGLVGEIRPVGAGHSFSPLVPTDGNLLVLDNLSGLISHDNESRTAVFGAGTRLGDAGPLLDQVGQAMFNLPDIDRQTIAGAISTSTHGTGSELKSLSGYVTELRLVTPAGDILDLSPEDGDLFKAAKVSLGALGVITRVGFQNRLPFKLKSMSWIEPTADVIESFEERCKQYQHYEFMPFPHADYSLIIAHAETDENEMLPPPEEDPGDLFAMLNLVPVAIRPFVFNRLLQNVPASEGVEPSFRALTNVRNDRFNEMEYSVPVEVGLECVREVLQTISKRGLDVVFPLEYRVVGADDCLLSMFHESERASISIHRVASEDFKPYFDEIEPIFWKYGGRPHWGKVHSMHYEALRGVYRQLDDFVAIQKQLDPKGQMLNKHLARVLGVA